MNRDYDCGNNDCSTLAFRNAGLDVRPVANGRKGTQVRRMVKTFFKDPEPEIDRPTLQQINETLAKLRREHKNGFISQDDHVISITYEGGELYWNDSNNVRKRILVQDKPFEEQGILYRRYFPNLKLYPAARVKDFESIQVIPNELRTDVPKFLLRTYLRDPEDVLHRRVEYTDAEKEHDIYEIQQERAKHKPEAEISVRNPLRSREVEVPVAEPVKNCGSSCAIMKKGGKVRGKKNSAVSIIAHEGELIVPKKVVPDVLKSSAWKNHVSKISKEKGISFEDAKKYALNSKSIIKKHKKSMLSDSESDW